MIRRFSTPVLAACAFAIAACSPQAYRPAPLDPAASAQRFDERRLDAPELHDYMRAHGLDAREWPLQRWGLSELTLLAFYQHPDLQVARSQAKAARAEAALAAQRLPLAVTPKVEHHSLRAPEQSSPWSLGFEIQIPLTPASTRDALRSRYDALAQSAELNVGAVAWEVRSRVRARLLDVYRDALDLQGLDEELRERELLQKLLEQRHEAGAASAIELNGARLSAADVRSRRQVAAAQQARDLAALAEALSMPLPAVSAMPLDFAELQQPAPSPQSVDARRAALLNRLDIRSKLVEYAAAEADVRLEIARQYPTLMLSPGFLWDQGDNIWSLAATIVPAVLGNHRAIDAAEARREVEANRFLALQSSTIARAQSAEAAYASLSQALAQAEEMRSLQAAHSQQVERQFAAGYADRVELTAARIEGIVAQRTATALRIEALRAQGALEDALQIPLSGGPLPQVARAQRDDAVGLAPQ